MNFKKMQFVVVAGILVLVSGTSFAQQGAVKPATKDVGGSSLTDMNGLFTYSKDTAGKSACTGTCLDKMQPYYQQHITPPAGMDAKDFGVITRADGKKQTTYRGKPLYSSTDKKAGASMGQGMGSDWSMFDSSNSKGMGTGTDQNQGMTPGTGIGTGTGTDQNKGMTPGTGTGIGTGTDQNKGLAPGTTPHKGVAPSSNPTKTY